MTHIDIYKDACKEYPMLHRAADVLSPPPADIIGRDSDELRKGLRNPEKANIVLLADPGTGKAIANNEWIPVADSRGYIRMGEIKIGDYVFDETGQPTKVIGVYPQGLKDAYRVKLQNKADVVCNDEHLWSVRNKREHYGKKPFQTKTLREMIDHGIVRKQKTGKVKQWYIPKAESVQRSEQTYTVAPYVIGALLHNRIPGANTIVSDTLITLLGKDVVNALIQMNLDHIPEAICNILKMKEHEKFIPFHYLLGSTMQRSELLDGLMDAGGVIEKDCHVEFSTYSEYLANDIKTLLFSLGFDAQIHKNPYDNTYTVCFLKNEKDREQYLSDSKEKQNTLVSDIAIERVEDLHTQVEMTCIRVEAPSHLFQVTKSHIVTHNTAYVQGFAYDKESLKYYLVLEVNPEKLIMQGEDRDSAMLTGFRTLVEEAGNYSKEHNVIVVLFIDEFHKVAMYSPSLVESLKPMLEKSALNNFRLIASTTFEEYNRWIASKNRALDQRFLQIKLAELSKSAVIKILKGRAKQHGVKHLLAPGILEEIYIESKRILLSNSQPRASIDILLSMIGETIKSERMENGRLIREFYTAEELGLPSEKSLSRPLLKKVIGRTHGIDIDNEVDVKEVIEALQTRLFNQDQAIETIVSYLEMAAEGFNDLDRPKISFLSTGPTGSGKACYNDTLVPVWTKNGKTLYKRHGELQIGDYVFNRKGKPVLVTGVYPQGKLEAYKIIFSDGNEIICNDEHLWTYKSRHGNGAKHWKTHTLQELMKKNITTLRANGRVEMNFVIPHNEAIEREAYSVEHNLHPYVLGALIGNGCLTDSILSLSSNDEETVARVADYLKAYSYEKNKYTYTWVFALDGSKKSKGLARIQTKDTLASVPELIGVKSRDRFIPEKYKGGSIAQRWELIQGLFDIDGTIQITDRYNVTYSTTSSQLAEDIQEVLYSLGISSSITKQNRVKDDKEFVDYQLHVQVQNKNKHQFFKLTRKRKIALESKTVVKQREKSFNVLGIREIVPLHKKLPMTCIMVDDEEHLYQVGKGHIVTHNTELAKIIAETMRLPMRRFDMSRYSAEKDAGAFADDLFRAVWSTPNAYILIDEVEKSSRQAMNILLQVLDDARLTDSDNPDRVASFSGSIINLTTNLASEIYQNMHKHKDDNSVIDMEAVYRALSDSSVFETAVLGRIDAIVPFQPLPPSALEKIAIRTLQDIVERAETRDRKIIVSGDVIPYIVKDRTSNDTERGGARDAKRNVKNLVVKELAHYLTYAKHEVPIILYVAGKPRFKYPYIADPLSGWIALKECYSIAYVDRVLERLSSTIGKPLINKGLYLPNDSEMSIYAHDIVNLANNGYNKFKSSIDGDVVTIEGVV